MQSLEPRYSDGDSRGRGEQLLAESSSRGGDEFQTTHQDELGVIVPAGGGGGGATDDSWEATYLAESHRTDEDEHMLAARLGLQLAEENSTLRQRLKAARSSLAEERECREDLEEQLASLSRQHTVSVQQRLKQLTQHEELVSSFQEKESANTTTIADLTRQVAALEARCIAAAEAAYLGEGTPSSLGRRHNALTPEQVRQSRLQRLERELEVTNADLQELHNQLAVSEGQVRRLQTKVVAAEQAREAEEESGRVLREELVRAQEELENLLALQEAGADVAAAARADVKNRSPVPLSVSNTANTKVLAASTSVASIGTNTSLDLVTISRAELRELEITKQLRDQSPANARFSDSRKVHDVDAATSPSASLALGGLHFDGTPPVTPGAGAGAALGNCLFFETSFHSMPGDLSMAMRDEDTPHSQATGAGHTPGTATGKPKNNSHGVGPAARDKENRVKERSNELTPTGNETSCADSKSDSFSPAQHESIPAHHADDEIEKTGPGDRGGNDHQMDDGCIDVDEAEARSSCDIERRNVTGGTSRAQAKFQLSTPPQLQLPAHIRALDSAEQQQRRRKQKEVVPPSPSSQTPLMRRLQLENTLLSSQLKRTRRIIAATAAAAAAAAAQTVRNSGLNTADATTSNESAVVRATAGGTASQCSPPPSLATANAQATAPQPRNGSAETRRTVPRIGQADSSSSSDRECAGNGPTVSWLQNRFAMQPPPKPPSPETMAMIYVVGAWICCCFLLL